MPAYVLATTFATLGVNPMLGRGFLPQVDAYGARKVAVISYRLWQQRFGAAPDVLHRQIRLDGENHEIVGVMLRALRLSLPDHRHLGAAAGENIAGIGAESQWSLPVCGGAAEAGGLRGTGASRNRRLCLALQAGNTSQEFSGRGGNVVPLHDYLVRGMCANRYSCCLAQWAACY